MDHAVGARGAGSLDAVQKRSAGPPAWKPRRGPVTVSQAYSFLPPLSSSLALAALVIASRSGKPPPCTSPGQRVFPREPVQWHSSKSAPWDRLWHAQVVADHLLAGDTEAPQPVVTSWVLISTERVQQGLGNSPCGEERWNTRAGSLAVEWIELRRGFLKHILQFPHV